MRIRSRIRTDAMRKAILDAARSMLGPLYDPKKEDEYVRVFRKHLGGQK